MFQSSPFHHGLLRLEKKKCAGEEERACALRLAAGADERLCERRAPDGLAMVVEHAAVESVRALDGLLPCLDPTVAAQLLVIEYLRHPEARNVRTSDPSR